MPLSGWGNSVGSVFSYKMDVVSRSDKTVPSGRENIPLRNGFYKKKEAQRRKVPRFGEDSLAFRINTRGVVEPCIGRCECKNSVRLPLISDQSSKGGTGLQQITRTVRRQMPKDAQLENFFVFKPHNPIAPPLFAFF